MLKKLFLQIILILTFSDVPAICQVDHGAVNDGPYIFFNDNKVVMKWIEGGILHRKNLNNRNFNDYKAKFGLNFSYNDLFNIPDQPFRQSYKGADSICAISDIHGMYMSFSALLRSQGVLDSSNNWNFGKGHLVILGDLMDRGENVTELLWHLYGLERQAQKAGGQVHILIGNHEIMNFTDDYRYMNPKYNKVEEITGMKYAELYSVSTVLGRWLRSLPVMISINNIIFVHGGISGDMVRKKMKIESINRLFSKMMLSGEVDTQDELNDLIFLNEEKGPLWYRGYFNDSTYCETDADSALAFYEKQHIVVGHTTETNIKSLFNNKIFGVDAGLGNEQTGAVLFIVNDKFYIGSADGKRKPL